MSDQSPFKVKIANENKKLIISIQGFIDKNFFNFAAELAKLSPKFDMIVFELAELTHIDSSGIKEWIRMIESVKPTPIALKHCPVFFVNQLNMVDGMMTFNTQVESCFVPYFNEELDKEISMLVPVVKSDNFLTSLQSQIERDGVVYNIDVVKEKYFKFLRILN